MVVVPPDKPVRTPEAEPTTATEEDEVDQYPPDGVSDRESFAPLQSTSEPVTRPGSATTVTVFDAAQPEPRE